MKHTQKLVSWGLVAAFGFSLLSPLSPAIAGKSARTQQEATAASLVTGALIYNYARRQNSTNGALALAGAAGSAYLWNKYSQERRGEKRQQAAREAYYRRRASYYHRVAQSQSRRVASYHRRSSRPVRRPLYLHRYAARSY